MRARACWLLALAVLASSTAGCATSSGEQTCYDRVARWEQPSVFEAFPSEPGPEGWRLMWELAPERLPFANGTLDERAGPDGYHLVAVEWRAAELDPGRGGTPRLDLSADGTVETSVHEDVDEGALLVAFEAFLANVSAAGEQTQAEWVEAFNESRTGMAVGQPEGGESEPHVYRYEVGLSEPYRLDELVADLGIAWGPWLDGGGPGVTTVDIGNWTFVLAVSEKQAVNVAETGERVESVTVDRLDRVGVSVRQDTEEADRTANLTREAFAALDLPAPALGDTRFRTSAAC